MTSSKEKEIIAEIGFNMLDYVSKVVMLREILEDKEKEIEKLKDIEFELREELEKLNDQ